MFKKFKKEYNRLKAETEGMSDTEKEDYRKKLIENLEQQKVFRVAKRVYKTQLIFGLFMLAVAIAYFIFGQ